MPTLQELQKERFDHIKSQKAVLDKARSANTPDEQKHDLLEEFHRMEAKAVEMHDKIVQEQTLSEAGRRLEHEMKSIEETTGRRGFSSAGGGGEAFSTSDAARAGTGASYENHGHGLGDILVQSNAYKSFVEGRGNGENRIRTTEAEFGEFKNLQEALYSGPNGAANQAMAQAEYSDSIKATFASSGLTSFMRQPGIVLRGVQQPHVADLMPQGTVSQPTLRYVREVSFTPSATAVAEGGLKPEASWSLAEVDASAKKIAVTAKLTEELMEDYPAVQSYVNQRLPFMVEIEQDNQFLNGDGTGANMRGILNTSGVLVQNQGKDVDNTTNVAGDNIIDPVLRGVTRVLSESFFEPTGIVYNPFDFMDVRLLKADMGGGANTGMYLFGSPAESGPRTLWGLPVVLTTRIARKTVLPGAFNLGAQIFWRKGISVRMTNSNEDDAKYNRVLFIAESRAILAVYLPQAFCKVVLT